MTDNNKKNQYEDGFDTALASLLVDRRHVNKFGDQLFRKHTCPLLACLQRNNESYWDIGENKKSYINQRLRGKRPQNKRSYFTGDDQSRENDTNNLLRKRRVDQNSMTPFLRNRRTTNQSDPNYFLDHLSRYADQSQGNGVLTRNRRAGSKPRIYVSKITKARMQQRATGHQSKNRFQGRVSNA